MATSPLTEENMASSKFSKVIFPEPSSVASTIAIKSASAIVVSVANSFRSRLNVCVVPSPVVAASESIPVPPVMVAT